MQLLTQNILSWVHASVAAVAAAITVVRYSMTTMFKAHVTQV